MRKQILLMLVIFGMLITMPISAFPSDDADLLRTHGYIPEEATFQYPKMLFEPFATLPTSYDARVYGGVSNVGSQGPNGLCWTFTATSALESSMLKNSQGMQDFSELHMAYSTAVGHAGKYGISTRQNPDDGGNRQISSIYLMRGIYNGIVNESDDPYGNHSTTVIKSRSSVITASKPKSYTVQNIIYLNGDSRGSLTDSQIKQAVMDYGGLGSSMYWRISNPGNSNDSDRFNPETGAYYYNGTVTAKNHTVTIVGWDDNYSATNFAAAERPTEKGAWLIKNSWGTDWGNDGFFWISYENKNFPAEVWAVDGVKPYEPESTVYEYDYSVVSSYMGYNTPDNYYARSYKVESDGEELTQVKVMLPTDNVMVSVDVITDFTGFSGYKVVNFKSKGSKSATYPGYYTIDLDTPIKLGNSGSDFAVVVKVTSAKAENSRIAHNNVGMVSGTAFRYSPNYGGSFEAIEDNLSIKAVTVPGSAEVFYCGICDELEAECICVYCGICGELGAECICCDCNSCEYCGFNGGRYGFGYVLGGGRIEIKDAVEILKYLAGLDNMLIKNIDSFNAALITGGEVPSIADAIEILKLIAGLPNVLM